MAKVNVVCFILLGFLSLVFTVLGQKTQCGLYGQPPCTLVPAPKGATPPCAGPGKTYCEHVPNYPKTQVRNIIRKLQYDIKIHLADEIPVEFNDNKPDPKYNDDTDGFFPGYSPKSPSPTYGVPNPLLPGSSSTNFETKAKELPKAPSPTYGVPKNVYLPPTDQPTVPNPSSRGGYVYLRPSANLEKLPVSDKLQVNASDTKDTSKSQEDERSSLFKIELTTKTPSKEPEFFFSEQFEPPPVKAEENLPNSPPAPFSTAVYQKQNQAPPEESLPELSLARETLPPAIDAKNYYMTNSPSPERTTRYSQSEDWFRRISRSPVDKQDSKKEIPENNSVDLDKLRETRKLLLSLIPQNPESGSDQEDDAVIINFDTARLEAANGGSNRTSRTKRQLGYSNRLCETTTQFIEPQAALARDGEWKFIVNQVETARQLVRVEYCASKQCSNMCILPTGYSANCEQKYVQKRLVAVDASGQNIYTDTFWFPSCCVCTISSPAN